MADTFKFFPTTRENEHFDVSEVKGMTGRVSRAGLRVMVFPEPFASLEITEGERVGPAKMSRVRDAVAALKASE